MILDFTNLNKDQQIELDKIFHNYKKKENLIYKILKSEKRNYFFQFDRKKSRGKYLFIISYQF